MASLLNEHKTILLDENQTHLPTFVVALNFDHESNVQTRNVDSKYLDYSPLLFSEDDDVQETESRSCGVSSFHSLLKEIKTVDEGRVTKLRKLLAGGVFPPPNITVPHLTASELLELFHENTRLIDESKTLERVERQQVTLTCASRLGQVKRCVWPDVQGCCYPDIYYNNGPVSEEFESLCQKFSQRFVGNETASSCNVWVTFGANTAKKQKRGGGLSPGRRLSHLAYRRTQMFSKDNLCVISGIGNHKQRVPERREIPIGTKRISLIPQSRKLFAKVCKSDLVAKLRTNVAQKLTLIQSLDDSKQNSRSKFKLESSKSSCSNQPVTQSIKQAYSSDVSKASIVSKRLDFNIDEQSVTHEMTLMRPLSQLSPSSKYGKNSHAVEQSFSNSRLMPVFSNVDDEHLNCQAHGVNIPVTKSSSHVEAHHAERKDCNQVIIHNCLPTTESVHTLNPVQRQKMLWAVAEALRSEGIGTNHPLFRPCARALSLACRIPIIDTLLSRVAKTSTVMLTVAKQHAKQVVASKLAEHAASSDVTHSTLGVFRDDKNLNCDKEPKQL